MHNSSHLYHTRMEECTRHVLLHASSIPYVFSLSKYQAVSGRRGLQRSRAVFAHTMDFFVTHFLLAVVVLLLLRRRDLVEEAR